MKKPDLTIPTHPASNFTVASQKEVCIEASDFGRLGTVWHSRVWSDADDIGFILSYHSGTDKLFTLADTLTNDGDLQAWIFVSEDGSIVTVFND